MDNFVPPVKPKHVLSGLLRVILILAIVAIIAVGGVVLLKHHKSTKPAATTKTPASSSQIEPSGLSIPTQTKHYDSTNYTLGFDYPSDWTVNDVANSKLTVISPALQLRGSDEQNFTGQIVLTIQPKQTSLAQFATGHVVAAMTSQKLTYRHPTPNQRAQTYLTFVNYEGVNSTIDALFITGDNGYTVGQSIPESDMTKDDPLVSISFLKCADSSCKTAGTATSIPAGEWYTSNLAKPLDNLLQSLIIN